MTMMSLIGQTGAMKSPSAPTNSSVLQALSEHGDAVDKQNSQNQNKSPQEIVNRLQPTPKLGYLVSLTRMISERVRRSLRMAWASCKKTQPTMVMPTISGTPRSGLLNTVPTDDVGIDQDQQDEYPPAADAVQNRDQAVRKRTTDAGPFGPASLFL